ncbi:ATP-dependent RNA helicase HrpA [Litoribacillus peritrichatus]|uniref:ATP-dependent RNA helicase HrpA n=1 Tax=Litoribacillus peritrichatus TaxID=718191 RepID=A0ABP7N5L1_9GAMM
MSDSVDFKALKSLINSCMLRDQRKFSRLLDDFQRAQKEAGQAANQTPQNTRPKKNPVTGRHRKNKKLPYFDTYIRQVESSLTLRKRREAIDLTIEYPEILPVSQRINEIKAAIRDHQVVVVAGETGSGKTTQIPKVCLELGYGRKARIAHTQPRRLAATSVSTRLAEELKSELGKEVGYQVRFKDNSSETTLIKLMTDGVLLNETRFDRFFNQYDCIIIDEAHERSLNIDFLLGYIKNILPKRPDLKVIITSATIDVERFSKHFNDAPVLEVSGRTYPVETLYRPLNAEDEDSSDLDLFQAIASSVEELEQLERSGGAEGQNLSRNGDVLVFLPGEREIREAAKELRGRQFRDTEILPLYSRLSSSEQNKIFKPTGSGRRIVLATNVAETSLTVPGIRYVIDSGQVRVSRYSYRTKVQRLPIEAISQASANQRKGRCGRTAPGVCIRLFSEEDFIQRPEFTDPEIQRTNLATVILQMLDLRLGDIQSFPFVEPPDSRFVNDGYRLLEELGAVEKKTLTHVGKQMARLPLDARIARIVIAGHELGSLAEVIIVAGVLGLQDPRERPQDKQQQAAEKHSVFKDDASDFVTLMNLWHAYEEQRQELSSSQLRKWCQKNFISYMRMREWRDMHRQLHMLAKNLELKENKTPADYASLHKALLTGLISQVGQLKENKEYQGARQKMFYIGQGTPLARKTPKWVVAAEMMETHKLFARMVARIEPQWVEEMGSALVKRNYSEPHWERKRAEVVAYERVSLYGLTTTSRRKVSYQKHDPKLCREIFIRTALVEGDYDTRATFFNKNRALINEVVALEEKTRRRDILVNDDSLYDFYDKVIPEQVTGHVAFERWRKKKSASGQLENDEKLVLTKDLLFNNEEISLEDDHYPEVMSFGALKLPLSYAFSPGKEDDGVTVKVPLSALKQVPLDDLDWLVPAFLKDRCVALIKGLPKQYRRNFVPVPDYVEKILPRLIQGNGKLTKQIADQLYYLTSVRVAEEHWERVDVDPHLSMNIQLVDDAHKVIDQSRDLHSLLEKWGERSNQLQVSTETPEEFNRKDISDWDFGSLPESWEYETSGVVVKGFPYLQDDQSSASIALSDSELWATHQHRYGVSLLLKLALKNQIQHLVKQLPKFEQTALCYATVGNRNQLTGDFVTALLLRYVDQFDAVRNTSAFNTLLDHVKANLFDDGCELAILLNQIMLKYQGLAKKLKGKFSLTTAFVFSDEKKHLTQLVYRNFLSETSPESLRHLPRYLDAIEYRLDKLQGNILKAQEYMNTLNEFRERYESALEKNKVRHQYDPNLEEFRWLIEELRVSYFAQALGTVQKVSDKRLEECWQTVKG